MNDFYEIDFLDVGSKRSGDAIALRYRVSGQQLIHVVDGGYQSTGDALVDHIRRYYGDPQFIDHVVVTHNDGDHAGGLRSLFESFRIGALWMLRPWLYAGEIIHLFSRYRSVGNLEQRLRELYPNLAELEQLALQNRTPIGTPFQGAQIGVFCSVAPTKDRYLRCIVESERTPEVVSAYEPVQPSPGGLAGLLSAVTEYVSAKWGEERFAPEETSAENEMSVVQFASIADHRVLLTGDAGRAGLGEAADYLAAIGVGLPGIDVFQVPHHGSRRNVSTEVLDRLLGPRQWSPVVNTNFSAVISAAKDDPQHPRKAVVRACHHRGSGGRTFSTENSSICLYKNSPYFANRGWGPVQPLAYPETQEA